MGLPTVKVICVTLVFVMLLCAVVLVFYRDSASSLGISTRVSVQDVKVEVEIKKDNGEGVLPGTVELPEQ